LGWEESTPLEQDQIRSQDRALDLPRPLNGNEASFLSIDDPDLVLDTWKPAEDGKGTILRFIDLGGEPRTVSPYGRMTAERRLRFAVWLQEAEKQDTRVLKNLMVKQGPIHYCDENQTEHLAEFVPVEKKYYPYRDAVSILDEWFNAHSDEQGLRDKLTVSGLSPALKAEKRAQLAQQLAAVADVHFETELRICRVRNNAVWSKPPQTWSLNSERLDSSDLRRQLTLQILRYAVLDGLNSFRVFLVEARRDFQRAKSLAFSVTSVTPAWAASSAISRSRKWRTKPICP